jgi:hypothetical protein
MIRRYLLPLLALLPTAVAIYLALIEAPANGWLQ